MKGNQRVRCPCCDSIFEIELHNINFNRGKIILNKLNSKTSHNSRKNQSAKKPKVTILDNNPLSIASFMEDNPDVKL